MTDETILWHDYETSGRDARRDRPLQFAAIRTTPELEVVAAPIVVRATLAPEVLPDPEACLVTGVVPGDHESAECSELEFAYTVHDAMSQAGTCVAGYNSIRFDDEFTRFLLWRCLLPTYDREWKNGNSRWDLLDALRAAYALRPDGIEWPMTDGVPSFRLEALSRQNGVAHDEVHDALADVHATIAMARLLHDAQPRLFAYLYDGRRKVDALNRLGVADGYRDVVPVVHVSGRFPADTACTSVVVPVAQRPEIANQVMCVDLRHDPVVLLDADPVELKALLYTRRDELPDDAPRVGIKTVHATRGPVVAPLAVLDDASWTRVQLDPTTIERRSAWVLEHRERLAEVMAFLVDREGDGDPDPDVTLYDGFVSDRDGATCRAVHGTEPSRWRELEREFDDERLLELLFRLRCREAPESLDEAEQQRFFDHLRLRLTVPLGERGARVDEVRAELAALRTERADDAGAMAILARVEALVDARLAQLS